MYVWVLSCVWLQSAVSQAPAPRQFYSLPAALEPRHQTQRTLGATRPAVVVVVVPWQSRIQSSTCSSMDGWVLMEIEKMKRPHFYERRYINKKNKVGWDHHQRPSQGAHTHTHTHTERERERERGGRVRPGRGARNRRHRQGSEQKRYNIILQPQVCVTSCWARRGALR